MLARQTMKLCPFTLFVLLSCAADASADDANKPPIVRGGSFEVQSIKDIAYDDAKDADPVRHRLDLYLPKGHKDFPVLMFVHGGAWARGNKNQYGPPRQRLPAHPPRPGP